MGALLSPTSDNFVQKTLGAQLLAGATTVTLNNTTNILNLPGVFIVDRINTNDVETPNAREVITYTGVSGSTLTGLTRNADGSGSDQDHAINAIVEFGPDILWAQSMYDGLTKTVVASTGLLDTTKVVDLTTAQTLTTKTLTSPVINTGVSGTAIVDEDDMTSNSATKVPTQQSVKAYVDAEVAGAGSTDGWTAAGETWTYASASTFTIAGVDRTTTFTKGTRLKFTQTTAKYAVVVSSSFSTDTTVTIAVNTDYTIANAAITSPYYSYQTSPQGYPGWFAYTPTYGGFSSAPTYPMKFAVVGTTCHVTQNTATGADGTSNATTFTFTLPIASKNGNFGFMPVFVKDSGANQTTPGNLEFTAASTTVNVYKTFYNGAWTGSGAKVAHFANLAYEIN